jgi:hypothetical protein
MSILLSAASLPAITLISRQISIDAGLWAGIALCAALIAFRPATRSSLITAGAFATAMLLTSLALVTA